MNRHTREWQAGIRVAGNKLGRPGDWKHPAKPTHPGPGLSPTQQFPRITAGQHTRGWGRAKKQALTISRKTQPASGAGPRRLARTRSPPRARRHMGGLNPRPRREPREEKVWASRRCWWAAAREWVVRRKGSPLIRTLAAEGPGCEASAVSVFAAARARRDWAWRRSCCRSRRPGEGARAGQSPSASDRPRTVVGKRPTGCQSLHAAPPQTRARQRHVCARGSLPALACI